MVCDASHRGVSDQPGHLPVAARLLEFPWLLPRSHRLLEFPGLLPCPGRPLNFKRALRERGNDAESQRNHCASGTHDDLRIEGFLVLVRRRVEGGGSWCHPDMVSKWLAKKFGKCN